MLMVNYLKPTDTLSPEVISQEHRISESLGQKTRGVGWVKLRRSIAF
jgi:hypothetical protein